MLVDAQGTEFDLEQTARREVGGGSFPRFTSLFGGEKRSSSALSLGASSDDLLDYVANVAAGTAVPRLCANVSPASENDVAGGGNALTRTSEQAAQDLELFRRQMRLNKAASQRGASKRLGLFGGGISVGLGSAYPGQYRLTEYCVVPEYSYDITGTCVENPSPQDEHDRNMLVKGENEPTFLIACRSEQEIEGKLRWRARQYVFGGGILSILCLAYLLSKLG